MEDLGGLGGGEGSGADGEEEVGASGVCFSRSVLEFSRDEADDGEVGGGGVGDGLVWREVVATGLEVGAGGEEIALWGVHGGLDVGEVDAGERFFDMELAGISVVVEAIPVKDAVGGVGVLLDFVDEKARADGVESA